MPAVKKAARSRPGLGSRAQRDACGIAQQANPLALGAVGPEPCAIRSRDTQLAVGYAAYSPIPGVFDPLVLASQLFNLLGVRLAGVPPPLSQLVECDAVVPLPGLASLLSKVISFRDLPPPRHADLVQRFHLVVAQPLFILGGGELQDNIDAVPFALPAQYLFGIAWFGLVGRERHDTANRSAAIYPAATPARGALSIFSRLAARRILSLTHAGRTP